MGPFTCFLIERLLETLDFKKYAKPDLIKIPT
jgi:hypothetical protein